MFKSFYKVPANSKHKFTKTMVKTQLFRFQRCWSWRDKDNRIPYILRKKLFKPLARCLEEDIYSYFLLDEEYYHRKPFPYTINPFPLIGYDEKQIVDTIKSFGWERPKDVDPNSSNCKLNAYGIIKHYEKYHFHPYDYELSMLIRLGIITRDEALRRVEDISGATKKLAIKINNELTEIK